MTQKANSRTEKLRAQIEDHVQDSALPHRSRSANTAALVTGEPTLASQLSQASSRKFEDELRSCEGRLEEMGRSIRMEHLDVSPSNANVEEERKRAEERRKRAAHARRLREKAAKAQNPHTRVQLRIDQQRDFPDDDQDVKIPMQVVDVNCEGGKVSAPMVDVRAVQTACLGLLRTDSTITSMLELAEKREKSRLWVDNVLGRCRRDHVKLNSRPGGETLKSRTKKSTTANFFQQERSNEVRLQQQGLKRRHMQDKECRTCLPLETRLACEPAPSLRRGMSYCDFNAAVPWEVVTTSAEAKEEGSDKVEVPRCVHPGSLLPNDRYSDGRRGRTSNWKPEAIVSQCTKASAISWGVFRGLFWVVWLLHYVRRRRWAADAMRSFCISMGEGRRLIGAVRRTNNSVRRVQRVCRSFMARKHRWCEQQGRAWSQYEDHNLLQYHELCEQAYHYEQRAKADVHLDVSSSQMTLGQTLRKSWHHRFNWKVFRIPTAHRRFVLGRWYIGQLMKKVRSRAAWETTVDEANEQHKDIQHFYRLCGFEVTDGSCDVSVSMKCQRRQASSSSLHLGERDVVELIGIAAQELRNVSPFQHHPANRDQPPQQVSSASRMRWMSVECPEGKILSGRTAFPWQGRHRRTHSPEDEQVGTEDLSNVDVDELFRRFTPRLRHI